MKSYIIHYIKTGNSTVLSWQNLEQHEHIWFHLLLLGIGSDYDLIREIQSNKFPKIEAIFKNQNEFIDWILATIHHKESESIPLRQALDIYNTLCDTIIKLGIIYSVNSEESPIAIHLSRIMQENTAILLEKLGKNDKEQMGVRQFKYLIWRVMMNFAPSMFVLGWDTRQEIEGKVRLMAAECFTGFSKQQDVNFWVDPREEDAEKKVQEERKTSLMVTDGNIACVSLEWLALIERQDGLLVDDIIKREKHLAELVDIYNSNLLDGHEATSPEEAVQHFIEGGIVDYYQIEAIHHLVVYAEIKHETLIRLMNSILDREAESNFYYDEFTTKILRFVVEKSIGSAYFEEYVPIIEKVSEYLSKQKVLNSILNHSKTYLALAFYYIHASPSPQNRESAIRNFLRYKNLVPSHISLQTEETENKFYIAFWRYEHLKNCPRTRESIEKYVLNSTDKGALLHALELIDQEERILDRERWARVIQDILKKRRSESIHGIAKEANTLIGALHENGSIYSLEKINEIIGTPLAANVFYGLCEIAIVENSESPIKKRGFESRTILLANGLHILFTFPTVAEHTFNKIFQDTQDIIKNSIGNAIATSKKNASLLESQKKHKELAYFDPVTWLGNKNKLIEDITETQDTLVFIEIADYADIIATKEGTVVWRELIKNLSGYLESMWMGCTYKYSDTNILCIVIKEKGVEILALSMELTHENAVKRTITNLFRSYPSPLKYHIGAIIPETLNMFSISNASRLDQYANIVLAKARMSRSGDMVIYEPGDEKIPETREKNKKILEAALDVNNEWVSVVPYFQIIFDPKNPRKIKAEALARIEYVNEDGKKDVLGPGSFISIAEERKDLPKITNIMFEKVCGYIAMYQDIVLSFNIHEDDWNDQLMMWAFEKAYKSGVPTHQIELEILENVPFNRKNDKKKIESLKSWGYKITIDDYGSQESNITKIIKTQPHNIKLDKDIIEALSDPEERLASIAAIKSVVSHAQSIGSKVTAEFIKSEEIYELVLSLGVDLFQGHYFAEAMPMNKLQAILKEVNSGPTEKNEGIKN